MLKNNKKWLLLITGSSVCLHLGAQPVNGSTTEEQMLPNVAVKETETQVSYSLKDLLQRVLMAHPSILGAKERSVLANYQLDSAKYQRFPTLSADVGRISSSQSNGSSSSNGGQQTTVTLLQPVYTFGRITSTINAADHRLSSAQVAQTEAILNLSDQTISAFYEVLRTTHRERIQTGNVEVHQQLRLTMQRRFDGAVGSESDLLLAQSRLDQAKSDLVLSKAQLRRAKAALATLLSFSPERLQTPDTLKIPVESAQDLYDQAKVFSPTLKKLKFDAEALKQDALATSAALYPQFVIRGERVQNNVPTSYTDNRLIAGIQFQPGAGLSAFSNSKAAESKANAAEQDLDKAKLDLADKCSVVYSDMISGFEQSSFLKSLAQTNKNLFESTLRQFQAGKRTWLDVMNSQREQVQTELSYADVLYNSQLNIRRSALLTGQSADLFDTPANIASKE